jgi:hypothetical protein
MFLKMSEAYTHIKEIFMWLNVSFVYDLDPTFCTILLLPFLQAFLYMIFGDVSFITHEISLTPIMLILLVTSA